MTLVDELSSRLQIALDAYCKEHQAQLPEDFMAPVAPAADNRFGDYQSNAAMMLAKAFRCNPRQLAADLIELTSLDGLAEAEIAGPGFINFRISQSTWSSRLAAQLEDERLGVDLADARTIVVDFSAPNVAKPMHVGHIRSTIIGDSLSRIATFLGHRVVTDNHIGDWGTQFGMVIYGWKNFLDVDQLELDPLQELLRLYRKVNALCKDDEMIKDCCRSELVKLQQGDEENYKIWLQCVEVSKDGLKRIYSRLSVEFDHWHGESFYNDRLADLVDELVRAGIASESDGALCVFSGGDKEPAKDPFKEKRNDEWSDLPMIVRKKDGAFNYATTDIATVDYRLEEWGADEILYVVDARQALHFRQLFDLAERRDCKARLEHVSFGTILGKDGKPLKTRDGDLPQLADVLDDAVTASRRVIEEKSGDLSADEKDKLAEVIGIGSVKFTELSHHRSSDYIFDLEKMVALQGDTAPYLQYSYVRISSIFRKLGDGDSYDAGNIAVSAEAEVNLARCLTRFPEILPIALEGYRPNLLATYLLDLAKAFHSFFEACPVLKADPEIKASRLAICELTRQVLERGLGLLGIEVPERM